MPKRAVSLGGIEPNKEPTREQMHAGGGKYLPLTDADGHGWDADGFLLHSECVYCRTYLSRPRTIASTTFHSEPTWSGGSVVSVMPTDYVSCASGYIGSGNESSVLMAYTSSVLEDFEPDANVMSNLQSVSSEAMSVSSEAVSSIDDGLLSCSGDGDYSGAVSNVLSIKSLTEAVSIANAELKAATKPKKRWWKRGGFSV
jgi:hypothetical protein